MGCDACVSAAGTTERANSSRLLYDTFCWFILGERKYSIKYFIEYLFSNFCPFKAFSIKISKR